MCKVLEEMEQEAAKRNTIEIVKRMLSMGKFSLDEIATCTRLTIDEILKLQSGQPI